MRYIVTIEDDYTTEIELVTDSLKDAEDAVLSKKADLAYEWLADLYAVGDEEKYQDKLRMLFKADEAILAPYFGVLDSPADWASNSKLAQFFDEAKLYPGLGVFLYERRE